MPWIFNWFPPGQDPDTGTPFPLTTNIQRRLRLGSLLGATGPAFTPVTQDVPFQPGSQLKFIKVPDAEIDMRIILSALTEESLWQRLATAAPYFNPLNGPGWLQIENPSGNIRRIQCTCISGLNIDPSTYNITSVDAALTFFANFPYWSNPVVASVGPIFPFDDGQNKFLPILPVFINRSGDSVIFETDIENEGDVNSYLTITMNGPLQSPIITNMSFGPDPITINTFGVLDCSANGGIDLPTIGGTGTRLTIDFLNKTIVKGVKKPVNEISKITPGSNFFPLLPGVNKIRIQLLGATAQTKVTLEWRSMYSTMY